MAWPPRIAATVSRPSWPAQARRSLSDSHCASSQRRIRFKTEDLAYLLVEVKELAAS